MATVYRAYDPATGREVAIKMFPDDLLGDPSSLGNFLHESRVAAALHHPQIVQVLSTGEADGRHYFVMELLKGWTLLELIEKEGRLPESVVIAIALDVVQGLQAAAAHGLIHGDVNPANIFVTRDAGAKILDFGLAKIARAAVKPTAKPMAAPPYCSPERLRSQPEDERSDMYSLGATLFEALTGRTPFAGATPTEHALQRLSVDPPRPREVWPELTVVMDDLVYRLLQREPGDRYPSYGALLTALRKARAAQRPGGRSWRRIADWWQQR